MAEQTMSLHNLDIYNEDEQCCAQSACTHELEQVLDGLLGLVAIADVPPETRRHFVYGIAHLRGHVQCELVALVAEKMVRGN